jgi:hypothetical protein
MEELLYDISDNVGEESQNSDIFFDDNAWDKVETLLDEEEKIACD